MELSTAFHGQTSDGGDSRGCGVGRPASMRSMDELKNTSVKNLKTIITEAGLECVGVVDREELIQLAATARGGDDPVLISQRDG